MTPKVPASVCEVVLRLLRRYQKVTEASDETWRGA